MSASSRRSFLKTTALLSAAAGMPSLLKADGLTQTEKLPTDLNILFQGDSITDGNRTRDNDWNHIMGHGYAYLISSRLWFDHPERKFHFFNRGVSGNKVVDLAKRWQTDTLDIKPDVLSILVGVNDVLAMLRGQKGFTADNYETDYRSLLKQTTEALPSVKLVIGEPFVLPVGNVQKMWDQWHTETSKRAEVAKQLAREFNAVFVPYQQAFNNALKKAPADYWIWDGVHPMPAGHELMAREWLKAIKGLV
ncbi:GDSL-type esterase/lipase family protein [Mucilaginibacter sp. UR6-1]|uniref:GDSL-type esterase/lipase family protein n=1 Tax=Mucilaginibacter sp. UR6-1 TaxID=1435643 RepID=UPI001E453AEC|nr:GDSL-type esterase/lipase family protein [Mucilaginibacter sp. UR6-1]MCC8408308.1 GDSL-type esterase/lipase family protein [Mucilaginibacter sp. UR6-1]